MKLARVHLELERDLNSVPLVGVAVKAIAQYSGLDETTSCGLELAVVEAVNNAIHYCEEEEATQLEVVVTQYQDKLAFHIIDSGAPRSGELQASLPQEQLAEGGYGLYLISELSDYAEWLDWEGRNCLYFWKALKGEAKD